MKLLSIYKINEWDSLQQILYVGDEFSLDPMDVMIKIHSQYPFMNFSPDHREHILKSKKDYDECVEDVHKLLTRSGYTVYNPCSLTILDEVYDG